MLGTIQRVEQNPLEIANIVDPLRKNVVQFQPLYEFPVYPRTNAIVPEINLAAPREKLY